MSNDLEYLCYWKDCNEPAVKVYDSLPLCIDHYRKYNGDD